MACQNFFFGPLLKKFAHHCTKQSIPVWIVNTVGIPTCSQHLLTWFVRRPDDGHVRTETCIVNTVEIPTCSQHLLTWFVRRPDDGHVRTETCIVNTVEIPTCSQHLLTWFVRRPDDGHVRTETCSLTHIKAWCVWRKLFYYSSIEL